MSEPPRPEDGCSRELGSGGAKRKSAATAVLAVLVVAALTKANTLCGVFVWDDDTLVFQNHHIRSLGRIPGFFRPSYWRKHHMTGGEVYRPIRLSSFALDYAVWGLSPFGFHLTNGVVHLLNVLLVCLLLRKWHVTRPFWVMAALLFVTRPTDVETVAWIKNRSDLFAAALFFGALLVVPLPLGRRSPRWGSVIAALLFAAALMAKEVIIGLPVLLMLVFTDFRNWRRAWWATVPVWIVAGGYLLVRAELLVTPPRAVGAASGPGIWSHLVDSATTLMAYARLLVLPSPLTLAHPAPSQMLLHTHWGHWVAIGVLLCVCLVRWRVGVLAFVWTGVVLFPVSNIIPLRDRPLAEQRLYIASLGLCLLLASASRARRPRAMTTALLCVAVIASALIGIDRAGLWSSNAELWARAVRVTPRLARPVANLGNAYLWQKRHARAATEYRRCLRANPGAHEATLRLGEVYEQTGNQELALTQYREAVKVSPRSVDARYMAAALLREQGRHDEALALYEELLQIRPHSPDAWHGIALVHDQQGDAAKAVEACGEAIALDPTHFGARRVRGVLLTRIDPAQAIEDLSAAIESRPRFVAAYIERARAHGAQGDVRSAEFDLHRALEIAPNDREAWRLLDRLPAAR